MIKTGPNPVSPLPWLVDGSYIADAKLNLIGSLPYSEFSTNQQAIVHRVNNWDALYAEVAQLRKQLRNIGYACGDFESGTMPARVALDLIGHWAPERPEPT